jgi:hypothetical protein
MTPLDSIQRDIESGLQKMRRDIEKQEPYRESSLYTFGFSLMAVAIAAGLIVIAAYVPRVKAQEAMFAPPQVFCQGAQKHINSTLKHAKMFKDAFAPSGEGARQVSQNIFNHIPAADHVIIIRQNNGGSIMVPCVWGKNGPEWSGEQSNRVAIDFVFKRDLDNPKTEINQPDGVDELPKVKKARKQ